MTVSGAADGNGTYQGVFDASFDYWRFYQYGGAGFFQLPDIRIDFVGQAICFAGISATFQPPMWPRDSVIYPFEFEAQQGYPDIEIMWTTPRTGYQYPDNLTMSAKFVPEPASVFDAIIAAAGFACARRRK